MHLLKWLYPGMKFKRWLLLFSVGVMLVSLGLAVIFNYKYLDNIEELLNSMQLFREQRDAEERRKKERDDWLLRLWDWERLWLVLWSRV